jgi:hypothetical protein
MFERDRPVSATGQSDRSEEHEQRRLHATDEQLNQICDTIEIGAARHQGLSDLNV